MKDEPKTIVWRPAIYVRGVGTIELTIEQVRKICAEHKRSCQQQPLSFEELAAAHGGEIALEEKLERYPHMREWAAQFPVLVERYPALKKQS